MDFGYWPNSLFLNTLTLLSKEDKASWKFKAFKLFSIAWMRCQSPWLSGQSWHSFSMMERKEKKKKPDNMKRKWSTESSLLGARNEFAISHRWEFWIKCISLGNEIRFCRGGKKNSLKQKQIEQISEINQPSLSLINLNMMIRWTKLLYKIFIPHNLDSI